MSPRFFFSCSMALVRWFHFASRTASPCEVFCCASLIAGSKNFLLFAFRCFSASNAFRSLSFFSAAFCSVESQSSFHILSMIRFPRATSSCCRFCAMIDSPYSFCSSRRSASVAFSIMLCSFSSAASRSFSKSLSRCQERSTSSAWTKISSAERVCCISRSFASSFCNTCRASSAASHFLSQLFRCSRSTWTLRLSATVSCSSTLVWCVEKIPLRASWYFASGSPFVVSRSLTSVATCFSSIRQRRSSSRKCASWSSAASSSASSTSSLMSSDLGSLPSSETYSGTSAGSRAVVWNNSGGRAGSTPSSSSSAMLGGVDSG
mmetsp:Transcript_26710/g.67327  ORF Transcript_26710/g.67327 Transcript_26710/m.67327 type:complete len:320 (-) Transcript_26710:151-1110(-)